MDEGREQHQIGVDASIVGHDVTAYSVCDSLGRVVFVADNLVDLYLYVGSKREH